MISLTAKSLTFMPFLYLIFNENIENIIAVDMIHMKLKYLIWPPFLPPAKGPLSKAQITNFYQYSMSCHL